VDNLPSIFGHSIGLWVLELFAMYATDERMDRRTGGWTTATLTAPFPTGGGIIKRFILVTLYFFEYAIFTRRFESRDSIL